MIIAGIGEVRAQRVYADDQSNSNTLFASISNPTRSINAPYDDYTTISATLGLLGLIEASQIVKFTNSKPTPSTPITIKFGATTSLLSLLDGIFIQPTSGTTPIGSAYSNTTVLSLLTALGTPTDAEITLPAPTISYDGIRLRVSSSLLGLVITSKLYYAFFIVSPTILNSPTICSGTSTTLTVSNGQPGYTYKWYSSISDVNPIQSGTSTTFTPSPNLTTTTTYYVEAVDNSGGTYYSARTPATININSVTGGTITTASLAICTGTKPNIITTSIPSTGTALAYQWQKSSGNNTSYSNIIGANTPTFTETLNLTQNTYYKRTTTSTLNSLECTAESNEILITVNPKIAEPHINVTSN